MPPRKPVAARPITMQPDTPNITFGELCAEVIRFKRLRNLAPDTIDYYEDCGNYLAEFLGEDTLCQSITKDTYYNYIEYLHQTKPHLKAATERSYLTGIRAILYYGMKKGYIPGNVIVSAPFAYKDDSACIPGKPGMQALFL